MSITPFLIYNQPTINITLDRTRAWNRYEMRFELFSFSRIVMKILWKLSFSCTGHTQVILGFLFSSTPHRMKESYRSCLYKCESEYRIHATHADALVIVAFIAIVSIRYNTIDRFGRTNLRF